MNNFQAEELKYESEIIWLMDISEIPYVRELHNSNFSRRKGKIKYLHYTVVGYSELQSNAPNTGLPGFFARRIFWLKEYDRYYQPNGTYSAGCPVEGVDPLTVKPGVFGILNERAWGAPLR